MVYEIRVRFKHSCPFLRFSKLFEKKPVYSYCSLTHDVIRLPIRISDTIKTKAQKLFPNFANWSINSPPYSSQSSIISMDCVCGMVYYHTIANVIVENGGVPIYPITYTNGWEYRKIVCFNDNDVQNIISAIKEKIEEENEVKSKKNYKRGIREKAVFEELEVNNIGETNVFQSQSFVMSDFIDNLTKIQLEVFKQAYQEGYYEIPRRVKLENLAQNFGKSRQAIEKSLRKAENKLINFFVPFLLLDSD